MSFCKITQQRFTNDIVWPLEADLKHSQTEIRMLFCDASIFLHYTRQYNTFIHSLNINITQEKICKVRRLLKS